jgi:hypothetical protein
LIISGLLFASICNKPLPPPFLLHTRMAYLYQLLGNACWSLLESLHCSCRFFL